MLGFIYLYTWTLLGWEIENSKIALRRCGLDSKSEADIYRHISAKGGQKGRNDKS